MKSNIACKPYVITFDKILSYLTRSLTPSNTRPCYVFSVSKLNMI